MAKWYVLNIRFVCLHPNREFFTHMDTSPLPVKGCKLTYTRHSWPLDSEGSLACHTYCDTGHPFIILRDTHTCCRAFSSGAVTTCFYDLVLTRLGFERTSFRVRGQRSNLLLHHHRLIIRIQQHSPYYKSYLPLLKLGK